MTRRARVVLGVACLAAISLIAACGGDETGTSGGTGNSSDIAVDSVSIVLRNDVDDFDPHKSAGESGAKQMFDAIYDTLVRQSPDGARGGMLPALASSWDQSPDSVTLQLKDGLTCTNGSPLSATGIVRSLERLADPSTGSPYASRIFGPAGPSSIMGDDDANTITIELNEPYTYLLEGLSFAYIICPDGLDDPDGLSTDPAETGPYEVTDLNRGDSYTLTRKDSAAVDDLDHMPKTIKMRVVNDDTTRANLIDTDQVNIASILGRDAERLEATRESIPGPAFLADSLLFNQADGLPGADPEFRRAVAMAVDPVAYSKAATFDLGEAIDTQYTPNMECYRESNGDVTPKFDSDAAKTALKEAGYLGGDKEATIRLLGYDAQNSGPDLIADSLRGLGLKVDVSNGTLDQAIGVLFGTGEWDVIVFPYPVTTYMPSSLVNQVSGAVGESLNVGNIQNETYNRLVLEANEASEDDRCDYWADAEKALLEAVDIRPLVWSKVAWFANGVSFDANYFYVDTRTIRAAD